MRRIIVIGNSGSGKSTLARELAKKLDSPHIEADALFHQPNWTETPADEFRMAMDALTNAGSWVLDGNYYRFLYDISWPKADTVVWLDYSRRVVLWRVITRTLGRLLHRTELWNGNRETWRKTFSKESIILWSLTMHHTYRKDYRKRLQFPEASHLSVMHFKSPRQSRAWVRSIAYHQQRSRILFGEH